MSDYSADIAKYTASVDAKAVESIVKYCGIALRNRDSSLVSSSDPDELARVRDGFAAKKLGLDAAAADAGIRKVVERMKGDRSKERVTFYYLLAEETGSMAKLA
ncbi:DUF2853 family protein [Quisquiliibacterium transsilvanicum]|uniref:Energy-coupling factor transporter ATP-binding protein EcfA2 n=1 Tax=Quisquiliibacterium transsilvanicum TaxID=1549638 RepID=A0A7W8M903_9BURK|nr:DUF2853 family protein [Quisquiliibacterium transsilvanicum]MBB5272172.1 energy-coupling factor transporter ATP-binding protein EcfA2 [Quisquiliibacterium transsilvanicum]